MIVLLGRVVVPLISSMVSLVIPSAALLPVSVVIPVMTGADGTTATIRLPLVMFDVNSVELGKIKAESAPTSVLLNDKAKVPELIPTVLICTLTSNPWGVTFVPAVLNTTLACSYIS